jgi:hypothetical protein
VSAHAWLAAGSAWLWPRLANHLWEGTLLALVVSLAALALRRAPARARHRLWLLLAVKLALPSFLFATALAWLPAPRVPGPTVEAVGRWVTVAPVADPVVHASSPAEHRELLCLATLLWLTGCACAVGLRLRRRSALARLLATARPLTAGPAPEALARVRRRSRSSPEVRLLTCPGGAHLGIAGLVRPVLLVPDALTRLLEPAEMEALLEHELTHLRRRDPLVEALQAALACALWFFPVVWLLGRRLAVERERALRRGGPAARGQRGDLPGGPPQGLPRRARGPRAGDGAGHRRPAGARGRTPAPGPSPQCRTARGMGAGDGRRRHAGGGGPAGRDPRGAVPVAAGGDRGLGRAGARRPPPAPASSRPETRRSCTLRRSTSRTAAVAP